MELIKKKELSRQNSLLNTPNIQSITRCPTPGSHRFTARSREARNYKILMVTPQKNVEDAEDVTHNLNLVAIRKKCLKCKKMNHFSQMC